MTGNELIQWIQDNHAEEKTVVIAFGEDMDEGYAAIPEIVMANEAFWWRDPGIEGKEVIYLR